MSSSAASVIAGAPFKTNGGVHVVTVVRAVLATAAALVSGGIARMLALGDVHAWIAPSFGGVHQHLGIGVRSSGVHFRNAMLEIPSFVKDPMLMYRVVVNR
jgi:hypothetical protein